MKKNCAPNWLYLQDGLSSLKKEVYTPPKQQFLPTTHPVLPIQCRTLQSKGIWSLTGVNCTSHLDNQTMSQILCYLQSQESLSHELSQGWLVTDPILLQNNKTKTITTVYLVLTFRRHGAVSPFHLLFPQCGAYSAHKVLYPFVSHLV